MSGEEAKIQQNKVALVLGSTGGIGSAVCRLLIGSGFTVVCASRSAEVVALCEALNKEQRDSAFAFVGSSDASSFWDTLKETTFPFSAEKPVFFDAIVCSTGDLTLVSSLEMSTETLYRAISSHVLPAMNAVQYCAKLCKADMESDRQDLRRCALIFIGSTVIEDPEGDCGPYICAKHALQGLLEAAKVDMFGLESRMSIQMINPPNVDTPLWKHAGMEGPPLEPVPLSADAVAKDILLLIDSAFQAKEEAEDSDPE